ncbi:MAG TPA: adenylate/guanylate cyclase domain-containing protein [Pseudolabrys sp.]|nr:adenylate/guanylate cyclase domain-containing protein [Pseudolabrys sp.]
MIAQEAIDALNAWLAKAGLRGEPEAALVAGFCERAVAAGLPLSRAQLFIDTLHPVYEGRLVRWGHDPSRPVVQEYGRTGLPEGIADPRLSSVEQADVVARWRASPFFHMLQTGESLLRRRITPESQREFPVLRDYIAEGMTDYVAIINRFAPEGIIGEMDCIYSSWVSARAEGFTDAHIAALTRVVPTLALAFKAAALTRMTGTLMETYLGRDAGRRVLSGRIMRGVAERIDAVIWFSDLRGFTRITDSAPEQVIPLLNDYADVIVSAIDAQGGDVLKLIGDGILAIFTAADRAHACAASLAAAATARSEVAALNLRRARAGLPVTDMYVGLHVGEVFYGNIGSTERLDFTVVGPAVNETSRVAAMCRSVEQPVLVSQAFSRVEGMRGRLVSVGRYALRGVAQPQELFTLDSAQAS